MALPVVALLLPALLSSVLAYSFEEAMLEGMEGREPRTAHYGSNLPFEGLGGGGTITIEQFVKELKKRKEVNEALKKKGTQPVSTTKKKVTSGQQKKVASRKKKPNKSLTRVKPSRRPATATVSPRKAKPVSKQPTTGKSHRKQKKITKASSIKKNANRQNQTPKTPLLKPSRRPPQRIPPAKIPAPVRTKPSTVQKPVQKTKKKIVKQEIDDDPFNFGPANAVQHSDHHIHHHDHLEAHKHHHKHKESHAHDHAHANDHVHNHKHTHNHVHNHIHKHNEAHEHTAEHAHTEKHTHKHLEYIDQGSWRRKDPYGEGLVLQQSQDLVLEEREGRTSPRSKVADELQNFIQSYKAYNSNKQESPRAESNAAAYGATAEGPPTSSREAGPTHPPPEGENYTGHRETLELLQGEEAVVSPLEGKSRHPVEVEEISYEEYVRLQAMGPTFEEPFEDYEDYEPEQLFDSSYDSYGSDAGGFGPVDQVGDGTEEHLAMPEYEGDWVDMDLDLQYDLGPEYLDYHELERQFTDNGSVGLGRRVEPSSHDDSGLPSSADYVDSSASGYQETPTADGSNAATESGPEDHGHHVAFSEAENASKDYQDYEDYIDAMLDAIYPYNEEGNLSGDDVNKETSSPVPSIDYQHFL